VIERTAVVVAPQWVEARLTVGLPAAGRRVLGREAEAMLCREAPRIVERALMWRNVSREAGRAFVECIENHDDIRRQLDKRGLVAFVTDGAVLPRESGASDRPLAGDEAVAFESASSLTVTLEVPNEVNGSCHVTGMGIPRGVTVIVGGGYHGKSTLLRALERGVHPHIPGDGREYVVTTRDAVKIRAEDGRRVEQLVDPSQTRAVGHAIHLATERFMDGRASLREVVDALEAFFDEDGLDALDPFHRRDRHPGNFARPRKYEIAAAINRLRTVRMRQK